MPFTPMQAWFSRPFGELDWAWPRALAAVQTKGAPTTLKPEARKNRRRDQKRSGLICNGICSEREEAALDFIQADLADGWSTIQAKVAVRPLCGAALKS